MVEFIVILKFQRRYRDQILNSINSHGGKVIHS